MNQPLLFDTPAESELVLPCITLWRPWAEWISLGWKTIETRTHARFASLEGKRIAIHAGLKWDKTAMDAAAPFLTDEQRRQPLIALPGHVICTALVSAHRPLAPDDAPGALIECRSVPRFGLFLTELQLVQPFPASGAQGIWRVKLPPKSEP